MRIVVPGPTSRTGLLALARAQRRGHQIVVFTRRPEARPDSPALAAVVRGDGRDAGTLAETLAGADAAISLLPRGGRADPLLASTAARALITAMTRAAMGRLAVVSACPVASDRPRIAIRILRRDLAARTPTRRRWIRSSQSATWTGP